VKPPRSTSSLRSVMRRYRWFVWLGVAFFAVLFVSCIAAAILTPAATPGLVVLGLIFLTAASASWNSAVAENPPSSFSLTERVKYRLVRLGEECKRYNEIFDDRPRRQWAARKLRAINAALFNDMRRYTQEAPTRTPRPADLFAADVTEFAFDVLKATRGLSGLIKANRRLPSDLETAIAGLVRLMDDDISRYDQQKRAQLAGINALTGQSGSSPDENLGRPASEIYAERIKTAAALLPIIVQATMIWVGFTIVFGVFYFIVPWIPVQISRDSAVTGYIAISVGIFLGYPLYRGR